MPLLYAKTPASPYDKTTEDNNLDSAAVSDIDPAYEIGFPCLFYLMDFKMNITGVCRGTYSFEHDWAWGHLPDTMLGPY